MDGANLSRVFIAARAPAGSGDPCNSTLEHELRSRLAAGCIAWPAIPLDEELFVRHLAKHASERLPPLSHAADLWIACACANDIPGAARAFASRYRHVVERATASIDPVRVDEATQIVLIAVLVGNPPAPPRIAEYAGRAPLRAWLATVAANATLRLHRRRGDKPHDSVSALAEKAVAAEPEVTLAKSRHGEDFKAALNAALRALDHRERVLLRLRHGQAWRLEQIAVMYGVSRATAARMVHKAHRTLLLETTKFLRERLRLTPSEAESLVGLLQSGIELSIMRLLETTEDL